MCEAGFCNGQGYGSPKPHLPSSGRVVELPDISNNVGSVKHFLSKLLRSLRRVVFLGSSLTSASTTTARS